MHTCPECGMACDCDGEDTWIEVLDPADCAHECEEEDWNGYTDPETGYDADDYPEEGGLTLEELRAAIQAGAYTDSDNIYHLAGTYSVSSAVLPLTWVDTVAGFRIRWGF